MPILLIKIIVAILVVSVLIYIIGKCLHYKIVLVAGNSMLPTLKDRQPILVNTKVREKDIKEGCIYVYCPPTTDDYKVIKRLKKIRPVPPSYTRTFYWFEGDNKDHSEDSRHYGYVALNQIKYRVVLYKNHSK